jgi:hypothetical protein
MERRGETFWNEAKTSISFFSQADDGRKVSGVPSENSFLVRIAQITLYREVVLETVDVQTLYARHFMR